MAVNDLVLVSKVNGSGEPTKFKSALSMPEKVKFEKGLNLDMETPDTGDIASPVDGDVWYDETAAKFRCRQNGVSRDMVFGYSRQTGNFNAAASIRYNVAANSLTATLPASPASGDTIWFVAETTAITPFTVGRNGNTIGGVAEDMTVDEPGFTFGLVYDVTADDWRPIE